MAILIPLKITETGMEGSKFRMAHVASQRAKMLMRGAKPLVDTPYYKPITIALQEIQEGKVSFYEPEEAAKIRNELEQRVRDQEDAEARAIKEKEKAARAEKEAPAASK